MGPVWENVGEGGGKLTNLGIERNYRGAVNHIGATDKVGECKGLHCALARKASSVVTAGSAQSVGRFKTRHAFWMCARYILKVLPVLNVAVRSSTFSSDTGKNGRRTSLRNRTQLPTPDATDGNEPITALIIMFNSVPSLRNLPTMQRPELGSP